MVIVVVVVRPARRGSFWCSPLRCLQQTNNNINQQLWSIIFWCTRIQIRRALHLYFLSRNVWIPIPTSYQGVSFKKITPFDGKPLRRNSKNRIQSARCVALRILKNCAHCCFCYFVSKFVGALNSACRTALCGTVRWVWAPMRLRCVCIKFDVTHCTQLCTPRPETKQIWLGAAVRDQWKTIRHLQDFDPDTKQWKCAHLKYGSGIESLIAHSGLIEPYIYNWMWNQQYNFRPLDQIEHRKLLSWVEKCVWVNFFVKSENFCSFLSPTLF